MRRAESCVVARATEPEPTSATPRRRNPSNKMRSIAAILFALFAAFAVSAFNVAAPAHHIASPTATRVTTSPVAFTEFDDAALENPNVCHQPSNACNTNAPEPCDLPASLLLLQVPNDPDAQPARKCAMCFG
jgi:hypothetical protein